MELKEQGFKKEPALNGLSRLGDMWAWTQHNLSEPVSHFIYHNRTCLQGHCNNESYCNKTSITKPGHIISEQQKKYCYY